MQGCNCTLQDTGNRIHYAERLLLKPASLGCRGESVAIVTIEKANATINKLAQQKRLGEASAAI